MTDIEIQVYIEDKNEVLKFNVSREDAEVAKRGGKRSMSKNAPLTEGQEAWVRPTHVIDPHDFYVRRITDDDWILTFQGVLEHEIETRPQPAFSATNPPKVGEFVAFHHPSRGWARGKVFEAIDSKHWVFLFDYGEFVSVEPSSLRPLLYGMGRRPLALHCRLNFCAPINGPTWNADSIATFIDYLGTEEMKITVMRVLPGGQLEVEVQNRLPDTVSMLMVVAERACFTSTKQQVNRQQPNKPDLPLQHHYYVNDSLLKGEEMNLRIIFVSDHVIHAVKEERYAKYLQMNHDIGDAFPLCKKLERDDLVKGTPVVWRQSMNSKTFYWRCSLLEEAAGGECVLVRLVDRGGKEEVRTAELRAPPTRLLQENSFSLNLRLNAEQELNTSVRALLEQSVSLTVRTEEMESDTQPYIVTVVKQNYVN